MAHDENKPGDPPAGGERSGDKGAENAPPDQAPKPRLKPMPPSRDPGGISIRWEVPRFKKDQDSDG